MQFLYAKVLFFHVTLNVEPFVIGFKFAGLQYGKQCFCGDSFGKYKSKPDADCEQQTCPGDSNQYCGGLLRNAVYGTGNVYN